METRQNASGNLEQTENNSDAFVTINTIDQTVYVERLPNPLSLSKGAGNVIKYGLDNLYPNKIKSMIQRSQSASSAVETLARFTAGQGFKEVNGVDINKLEINSEGQTLFDILDHASNEKSVLGVALHFNYNILGQIIEIQEIPFETIRLKSDFSKYVFCPDWSRSGRFGDNKKIEYYPFDPEKAREEMLSEGIDNYPGQILYWIKNKKQIYPLSKVDPSLDDVQFEHESGVYKLRNVQNGYSAGYIMFYPSALESELEKKGLINDTKQSRGSQNAGKTKHIPLNASFMEAMKGRNLLEEIPRNGIDKFFQKQNEETRFNIFASFNQPPILNGITKDGMFNQESFIDAFDFYNSITEKDRQETERIFNKFLPYTVWNIQNVEIEPLDYMSKRENPEDQKKAIEKTEEEK